MTRLSLFIVLAVLVAVSNAALRVVRSPQFAGAEARAGAIGGPGFYGRPEFGGPGFGPGFGGPGFGGPGFGGPGFGGPGFGGPGFGGPGFGGPPRFGHPGEFNGGFGPRYLRPGGSINIAKSVSISGGK